MFEVEPQETEELQVVVPYRRTRLQSIGWLLVLGAIGLVEARLSVIGLALFAFGACYTAWLSWRDDNRWPPLDWATLPTLPASSAVEGPIRSALRTLTYTAVLVPFLIIGILLPHIGGLAAGAALGSASWTAYRMRMVTTRERRGGFRVYTSLERRRWHVVTAGMPPPNYYRAFS